MSQCSESATIRFRFLGVISAIENHRHSKCTLTYTTERTGFIL